jgi:hypothetical protein
MLVTCRSAAVLLAVAYNTHTTSSTVLHCPCSAACGSHRIKGAVPSRTSARPLHHTPAERPTQRPPAASQPRRMAAVPHARPPGLPGHSCSCRCSSGRGWCRAAPGRPGVWQRARPLASMLLQPTGRCKGPLRTMAAGRPARPRCAGAAWEQGMCKGQGPVLELLGSQYNGRQIMISGYRSETASARALGPCTAATADSHAPHTW